MNASHKANKLEAWKRRIRRQIAEAHRLPSEDQLPRKPSGSCVMKTLFPDIDIGKCRVQASQMGLKLCVEWLDKCQQLGWQPSAMNDLEALFWKYRDKDGRLSDL